MKALVIGILGEEAHDNLVRVMFVLAYNNAGGSITTADVGLRSTAILDYQGGFDYCKANNIDIMICSYSGASGHLVDAMNNYPDVTFVTSSGSNTPHDLVFDKEIPQVICITGAGDTENETGINIEFFDNDYTTPETIPDEQDLSSFSNGYIAGKLKYIADQRNCTIWEARYCAMKTASENYVWDSNNGYGIIDVPSAIAYSGEIPPDPFSNPITASITATPNPTLSNTDVTIEWSTTNATTVTLNGVVVNANGTKTINIATATSYTLIASNEFSSKTEAITVSVDDSLDYTLKAGLMSVKLKFNSTKQKTIYRKVNNTWTEIATINSDIYEDTVERQATKLEYKIDGIEKDILFTEIKKLYQR